MTVNEDKVSELLDEVRRQNTWLKFQNHENVRNYLQELDADDQLIYHHTDGESSTREVAAETSYSSKMPVHNRMKEWRALGLVFKNSNGKWEHLAPLDAFGLDIPESEDDGR